MELTADVIKQYHLEQAQAETLKEKQELFLRMVRNYKDFAILQHRKMWIWIAKQYAKGSKAEPTKLKRYYIVNNCYNVEIHLNCFCCEYAEYNTKDLFYYCDDCPIKWIGNCCTSKSSEYLKIVSKSRDLCDSPIPEDIEGFLKSSYFKSKRQYMLAKEAMKQRRKCAKLAYKISQLPERKEQSNED